MTIFVKDSGKNISLSAAKRLVDSGNARIVQGNTIQLQDNRLNVEEAAPGSLQERALNSVYGKNYPMPYGPWYQPSSPGRDLLLTIDTLRRMHRKSGAVRPAVSFLVRTLSTTPWRIVAQAGVPKRDFNYAVDLFTHPGPGAKTFREMLAKVLTDLIVLDDFYIEKIRAVGGSVVELAPRDPATFHLIPGKNGEIEEYIQTPTDEKGLPKDPIHFSVDDIARTVFYGRTDSFSGTPPLEAITNEVSALLMASRSIASFFSEDEIPMGILHLGEIGREAYARAKADFESNAGTKQHQALRVTFGKGEPRWVQFQRPWREMEIANIMPRIERIVFRNFGVTPMDLGMSQDVNRSTAEEFKAIRTFTLFKPILDLLAEVLTFDVLHEINEGLFLEFQHFSRTGEESDAGATGSEEKPVDTDIPGEGEGESTGNKPKKKVAKEVDEEERSFAYTSPLFGATGMRRFGYAPVICRPTIIPRRKVDIIPFDSQRINSTELLDLVATDGVFDIMRSSVSASEEVIQVLLEEACLELDEIIFSGKADPSDVRVVAETTRDSIVEQVGDHLENVEEFAASEVFRVLGTVGEYKPNTENLLKNYVRRVDELVVQQLLSTTLAENEEAAMIGSFDLDKLSPESLVREIAAAPYREVLKSVDN
jgi:hypothetical protein